MIYTFEGDCEFLCDTEMYFFTRHKTNDRLNTSWTSHLGSSAKQLAHPVFEMFPLWTDEITIHDADRVKPRKKTKKRKA